MSSYAKRLLYICYYGAPTVAPVLTSVLAPVLGFYSGSWHHREQLQAPEGPHFRFLRLPVQVLRVPIQVPVDASSTSNASEKWVL
jgi:hypothetical protein